jgi:hypothetical protein
MKGEAMQFDDAPDYDPTEDEPQYSKREVDEMRSQLVRDIARQAFLAGYDEAFKQIIELPLTFCGKWQPDTAYKTHCLVHHASRQWLSMVETASEPSTDNAYWRPVALPNISESDQ